MQLLFNVYARLLANQVAPPECRATQLGRENNDCWVRYKLSVVVAPGETFNPEAVSYTHLD
ncbi:Uncharacterized protein DBV15_01625, partial [Temnothorax longispinosus]